MSYGNPVPGIIHPLGYFGANGELRPAGNTEFVVTRDCAGHRATNQGCALDLGNLRCDGKVFAVAAGRVQSRDNVQGIIRIDHADGSRSAYAHMVPILVSVGQTVTQGQQIGEVGDAHDPAITNFSGCHLHFAIQLTATGPEVDAWPLLAQNQEKPMPAFKPAGPFIGTFAVGAGHALISSTDTKVHYAQWPDAAGVSGRGPVNVVAALDLKTAQGVPVDIEGTSPPLNRRDQVYLVDTAGFGASALALRQDGVFTPATGHTDAELIEAARKAGHNAAVDVQAVTVTALNTAAAKYP